MGEDLVYWADANILLRFLTGSPPEMAERAAWLLKKASHGEVSVRIHQVAVAETVWVLQSFYGYTKEEIAMSLVPLLTDHGLKVESPRVVIRALETMSGKNVDFADALLAETARARGEGIASFDAGFKKLGVEWHKPV